MVCTMTVVLLMPAILACDTDMHMHRPCGAPGCGHGGANAEMRELNPD